MKKLNYKAIATILLFFSIMILVIFINESIDLYIKTIAISLAINLISSIIIIYLIDIKKEKEIEQELFEKRQCLYKKLYFPIVEFKKLILKMYKATVSKEKFYSQIYTKKGKDPIDLFNIIESLNNEKKGYIYDYQKRKTSKWKDIIIAESLKYIEFLDKFYNDNVSLIESQLANIITKIIKYKNNKHIAIDIIKYNGLISTKDLMEVLGLQNIYNVSIELEKYIKKYTNQDYSIKENEEFKRDDIAPRFESGIDN